MCFYRRSEIPSTLIPLADKHHFGDVVDMEHDSDDEELSEKETNERSERALNIKYTPPNGLPFYQLDLISLLFLWCLFSLQILSFEPKPLSHGSQGKEKEVTKETR